VADTLYRQVIVGTDGSPTAACAVRAAIVIASATGATLTVLTAWKRKDSDALVRSELVQIPGGDRGAMESQWAEYTVAHAAAIARSGAVGDVGVTTPQGNPGDALVRVAEEHPGSLLVVGTIGLDSKAERLMGNVPHHVTHHAPGDLLLVRTQNPAREVVWTSVALATDASQTADMAVAHGLALADALGARPALVTVAKDQGAGDAVLTRATGALPSGATVGREVATSKNVVHGLVELGRRYDLLVLGNRGMMGKSRLLGSVANEVTHEVPTDILLVNTTAAR